jgi:predicted Zn-ribbon and HTH transcriptional regulator
MVSINNRLIHGTVRQRMHTLLVKREQDIRSLSQQLGISEKEVMEHLPHLVHSARRHDQRFVIVPSTCRSCGFTFKNRKRLTKPGRCPRCKATYLTSPVYRIKLNNSNRY